MANNVSPDVKRILVVDDDLELCQVIVDTLRESGYNASFVQTTEEALEKILPVPPDLILLDLEVPKMGGLVLCHGLRNTPETKNTPIVFLSVRDSDIDKRTAASLGANLYITKPFRRSHLLKEVHSILFEGSHSEKSADRDSLNGIIKNEPSLASLAKDENSAPSVLKDETVLTPSNLEDNVIIKDTVPAAGNSGQNVIKAAPNIGKSVSEKRSSAVSAGGSSSKARKTEQSVTTSEINKKLGGALNKQMIPFLVRIKDWAFRHKPAAIAVAFTVVVGLMWGSVFAYRKISDLTKKVKEQVKKETGAVAVNVIEITASSFRDILSAVGTVAGGSEIELRFQVEGNIRYINFKEGDAVHEGLVIAQLDQSQTLIKLERARSEFYRYEKLYALGGVSKDRLDEAKVQYDYAKTELNKTVLRASKDGIFGDKGVEVGEFVTPQKKVGTLISLDPVLIRVGVIEKEIDKVFPGQAVTATVDTYPDVEFKGTVENISPLVQGQSKTLTLEARMPNKGKLLLPGMFARTKIVIYEKENVISVPNDALEKTERGYKLFVVGKEDKAEERIVEVTYVSPTHSVIDKGLLPGEKLIAQKPQDLKAGVPLKIIEVEKASSASEGATSEMPKSEIMEESK